MINIKWMFLVLFCGLNLNLHAQDLPGYFSAIQTDDTSKLSTYLINKDINQCYDDYSLLSHSVRLNANQCFTFLLNKGANVNAICNGYIPPLMHAAKYGRLEMVKRLVSKGADVHYKYTGDVPDINDMTPLAYAEKFKQTAVAEYLKSIK